MKKISIIGLLFCISPSVFALGCVDLKETLSPKQENVSVKKLQDFLFEKGFLKAKPNGYFGVGTISSVKAYQKSVGLSQAGIAGPATRAAIKKESCLNTNSLTQNVVVIATTTVYKKDDVKEVVKNIETKPKTPAEENNLKRIKDVELILQGLYNDFTYTGGVILVPVTDTQVELCVVPQSVLDANATATVPVFPCKNFVDITRLSPYRLKNIPRDPKLATSSIMTGYFVTRNSNNTISVIAKNAENGITIKASCNFNNACKDIQRISHVFYDIPSVASTSRSMLIRDSSLVVPFVIYGKNFTATNTIVLSSKYSNKKYTLGAFPSVGGTTITLQKKDIYQRVSCGSGCTQEIPLGEYDILLSNEGGVSESTASISIKGYNASIVDNSYSVRPDTKNTKFASLTLTVDIPVTIKTLTLIATGTPSTLVGKVSRLAAQDVDTAITYGPSTSVLSLGSKTLTVGQVKKYDIYADVGIMSYSEVGVIRYTGYFTVSDTTTDPLRVVDMTIPIKDVFLTISY